MLGLWPDSFWTTAQGISWTLIWKVAFIVNRFQMFIHLVHALNGFYGNTTIWLSTTGNHSPRCGAVSFKMMRTSEQHKYIHHWKLKFQIEERLLPRDDVWHSRNYSSNSVQPDSVLQRLTRWSRVEGDENVLHVDFVILLFEISDRHASLFSREQHIGIDFVIARNDKPSSFDRITVEQIFNNCVLFVDSWSNILVPVATHWENLVWDSCGSPRQSFQRRHNLTTAWVPSKTDLSTSTFSKKCDCILMGPRLQTGIRNGRGKVLRFPWRFL